MNNQWPADQSPPHLRFNFAIHIATARPPRTSVSATMVVDLSRCFCQFCRGGKDKDFRVTSTVMVFAVVFSIQENQCRRGLPVAAPWVRR